MAKKPMMGKNNGDADDDKPPQPMMKAVGGKPPVGKGGGSVPSKGPGIGAAPAKKPPRRQQGR